MNFKESMMTALGALISNKLRALLTMLGVIIGVTAVITMIGIGEGAQKSVMDRIQSLGSNLLFVSPGVARGGGMVVVTMGSSQRLTRNDAEAINARIPEIEATAPEISRNVQVKYENKNWNTRIVGTTPEYETVRNFKTVKGRYFTHSEERAASKVAVLGANLVETLFENIEPIGKTIRIGGKAFEVIGVLESKGQSGWNNPDDQIIIPLTTAQRRVLGVDYLSTITAKVASSKNMDRAFLEMERVLRREHKLRESQDNDFWIRNQADLITTFQETQQTFTFLLAGIAAVSLLVGGIGIMNIMIVSVTERTREIGVRKAIGATKRDVMLQFLIESIAMSVTGGLIGIAVGLAAEYLINAYGTLPTVVSPNAILLSFLFAAFVGISFGMYPAWKAANQNTIDALRYE